MTRFNNSQHKLLDRPDDVQKEEYKIILGIPTEFTNEPLCVTIAGVQAVVFRPVRKPFSVHHTHLMNAQ